MMVLGVAQVLLVAPAVASPQPAAAVTGGSSDGQHTYVVAIIPFYGHSPTCSGVWSALPTGKTVVITDAHCVPPRRGDQVRVFFGQTWSSGAPTYVGRSQRHPDYDPNTHENDVAIIRLSSAPTTETALLASRGSASTQSSVTTVGYGAPSTGDRRQASERVTSTSSSRLYLRPGSGNSCDGDSGGPDLIPGQRKVVALTDDGSCSYDNDTRLDTTAMEAFLNGV